MRGYMTMKQAFECGDDDIPFIDGEFNDRYQNTKKTLVNYKYLSVSYDQIQSDKWQVKTAEPVVLSPTDLLTVHLQAWDGRPHDSGFLLGLIMRSGENYRLERDLELRGLVDAVTLIDWEKGTINFPADLDAWCKIKEAIKNLKPLSKK